MRSSRILYLLCVGASVFILSFCSSSGQFIASLEKRNPNQASAASLEGAFEFVSETITLNEPRPSTEERTSKEWAGLWLFKDGHFSETVMRRPHSVIGGSATQGPREYGFEGSAGTYRIEGNDIELKNDLSIYPLAVNRVRTLQFQLEGDRLTLTERFTPSRESPARGSRVTLLRRIER
jgi:hypothetical protein